MAKRGSNKLDDMQIRRWVADGKPIAKTDGGGLTFTLSKAGTATWVLRYMRDAKAKELTIGNYPDITLAAARKLASKRRVEIDGGLDPAAMKRTARLKSRAAWLVGALIDDYSVKNLTLEQYVEDTIYYREWDFKKIIRPKLGPMEVRAVSPVDIVHMLETSRRSWAIQKRILTSVSKLFDHAVGKQIISINPCVGIKLTAMLGPKPPVKKRVMLSEQDLRALLSGIDDIGAENALAFRVMLVTCVRTVELVKARWEHVDFVAGTWYVPDDSVKTRQGFLVPITPTVGAWFRRLKELSDGSEWVLPARSARRAGKCVGRTTLWAALTRAFERGDIDVQRFTPHDTRSTAKSHMRNLGVSKDISEIALNHALKGMEGIYDVREEIPERRAALELWAAFIGACESGQPWNVVPLRSVAR